jgi:hypothetical protein
MENESMHLPPQWNVFQQSKAVSLEMWTQRLLAFYSIDAQAQRQKKIAREQPATGISMPEKSRFTFDAQMSAKATSNGHSMQLVATMTLRLGRPWLWAVCEEKVTFIKMGLKQK